MSFEQALSFTLPEEGGFVDNPDDDGGATDHGITQHVYDFYRGAKGEPTQSVALISSAEVEDIYQTKYWVPGHCAELPAALGIVHFDWCVNHGVGGAIKTLQGVLGVTADGVFGPATRAALEGKDTRQLVSAYGAARGAWYTEFVKLRPEESQFYNGWTARDFKLTNWALGVADASA
jgi:lysozyme family protein